MNVTKKDWEWLQSHATMCTDGSWICKSSHSVIQTLRTGRSIWMDGFCGGRGEVRHIDHLWCPSCGVEPKMQYGHPIYESELY